MLQRKQSLFLLVALIANVLTFFFPLIRFLSDEAIFEMYACRIQSPDPTASIEFNIFLMVPLALLLLISAIMTIYTIFRYKKRMMQLQLIRINVLLSIICVIGIFFIYPYLIKPQIEASAYFKTGAHFPLISLIFLIVASRFILKDEKLVRSIDRIR